MAEVVELRAYRFALDATPRQVESMRQHAGAARWTYNHALATKLAALDDRRAVITALVGQGIDPKVAAAQAPKVPMKPAIQKALNQAKGDDRIGQDGLFVEHPDRLARFGVGVYLLAGFGIEVLYTGQSEDESGESELVRNMLVIVTSFAGRLYGQRSARTRRLRAAVAAETECGDAA